MREADPPHVRWHKSSYSSASGQCVEVASVAGAVVVRDSKNLAGPDWSSPARPGRPSSKA